MAATDARPVPKKNTAFRVTFPIFDADGDLVTGAASLDTELSGDGGTFADATNEATEIATASGMYYLDLTAGEMNYDTVAIIVKTSTSGAKTTPIVLYPEEAGDIRVDVTQISGDATAADNAELMFDGTGYAGGTAKLGVDVVAISGDTAAADNLESYTDGTTPQPVNATQLSGDATAADNAEAFFDGTGYAGTNNVIPTVTTVNGLAAGVVTAAAIATGAIDADAIADNAIDAGAIATGAITNAKFAAGAIDAAAIATGAIDADAIADSAIDAGAIATGAITNTKFAAGAIDAAAIADGAIDAATLAADIDTVVDDIWDDPIGDSTLTARQVMKMLAAALGGKSSGGGSTTVTFRNVADSANVIVATVDSSGNRSAVTLTV